MHKGDEQVLVFPHCGLPKLGAFPGLVIAVDSLASLMSSILPNSRFMFRKDVEDDPTMQQLIPYVVCRDSDRVLVYNRGAKGGEQRLADKWSIGIGGHINPEDMRGGMAHVLMRAADRELTEELGENKIDTLAYVGVLKTETSEVDLVHTGIVYTATFTELPEIKEPDEIERHRWVTVKELADYKLEAWSEVVRGHLTKEETQCTV